MDDATRAALFRLHRGLGQLKLMSDDPRGASIVTRKLHSVAQRLRSSHGEAPDTPPLQGTPPRRVAVAMALAVFSQPHLSATFRDPNDPSNIVLEPLVPSNEVLEQALGLSTWELDDLREDVDRRAGSMLKQVTVVRWLRQRYANDAHLYQALFPGADPTGVRVEARGGHIYMLHPRSTRTSRRSLHLPWEGGDGSAQLGPLDTFRGRYVDANLKHALCRGIGLPDADIPDLLERTIIQIPADDADALLAHDQWRRRGFATVTGLGQPYSQLGWLTAEADATDVHWENWLRADTTPVSTHRTRDAFSALMQRRIHFMLVALYTDLLANAFARGPADNEEWLTLIDVASHVAAVSKPLMRWIRSKGSITYLARAAKSTPPEIERLLKKTETEWSETLDDWIDPAEFNGSVLAKWMGTVSYFERTLHDMLGRSADPRWGHREVFLLFAGHYIAEHPMDRNQMKPELDPTAVGPAVRRWFWPTWHRLLDTLETEAATTNPEFVIPDGLF